MKRQTLIWITIGVLFVVLLAARAILSGPFGLAFVEKTSVAFVKTPVVPPIGADADEATDLDGHPRFTWPACPVPADAPSSGVWRRGDVIGWTEYSPSTATAYYRAEKAAREKGVQQDQILFSPSRTIGLWLAAFFTLAAFSFLYRDNPFYKFTEAVVVGVSAAYWMVTGFWDTLVPKLFGSLIPGFVRTYIQPSLENPDVSMVVAMALTAVLGVMLLCQLVPKVRWMAVWPLAFVIGTTAGFKLVSFVESDFLAQLKATTEQPMIQIISKNPAGQPLSPFDAIWASTWASVSQTLLIVGTICTLVYFFFSVEHRGIAGKAARFGIWVLMITFGASFGYTVMGRVTLLAKRFEFLFSDWLWLIDPKHTHEVVSMISGGLFGASG